ncbi:hypothetical protein E2C01_085732 [Portunus trituberculatus]|uniref:Uncharacterized protein n=1 Tax=Portunus trituberculatus TaxID=210409 RepID=A0A5B7JEF5_PORTR|nr:hypothetical protein [Portunus trituberculatus]
MERGGAGKRGSLREPLRPNTRGGRQQTKIEVDNSKIDLCSLCSMGNVRAGWLEGVQAEVCTERRYVRQWSLSNGGQPREALAMLRLPRKKRETSGLLVPHPARGPSRTTGGRRYSLSRHGRVSSFLSAPPPPRSTPRLSPEAV